ncbi:MAG: SRPBCC family protein [Gemmatimonadetes bacterium]|nr:SRPBCC family protein [Gemmatimonadota bacterium]MDA1103657.1 SRPBCC family protein [Gemmatimonadota bacterium]
MPSHGESIVIRRSVADVFAYMNDITREREWQPHLIEADQVPAGPATVGTRRRYVSEFLGKRLVNTYVVTLYEAGRHVVCESTKDSVLDAKTDLTWEEVDGGTRVTMAFEGSASGPLKFIPARMLQATFENEVSTALKRLKERLEAGGPS